MVGRRRSDVGLPGRFRRPAARSAPEPEVKTPASEGAPCRFRGQASHVSPNPLTPETLRALRKCLSPLHFDPARDGRARECPGFGDYLDFYDMDLGRELPATFHALGRVDAAGYRIACHYWLPAAEAQGTVLVLHGYFDHVGLFGHLIRYLLARSYAVVAFDLPGHGLSNGERASIASFDHYVAVFEAIAGHLKASPLPAPLSAIGQSTGGAILLKRILEQGGRDLHRVTLLAPLVAPALWWLNRLLYALVHRFRTVIPRKFLTSSSDRDFLDFLSTRDPMQSRYVPIPWIGAMKRWVEECRAAPPCDYPLTILQGTCDTTLAWRSNLRLLRRKFPRASVILIDNARHHMANEERQLRERIFDRMGF